MSTFNSDGQVDDFKQGVHLAVTVAMTIAAQEPKLSGTELVIRTQELLETTVFQKTYADQTWRPLKVSEKAESSLGGTAGHHSRPATDSAHTIADWLDYWNGPLAPSGTSIRPVVTEIHDYLMDRKLINAIKNLRAYTGFGLRESKLGVEEYRDRLRRRGVITW